MTPPLHDQPEYAHRIHEWERWVPWYRRVSAHTGLQGKLVVCFMVMLVATLGASTWHFIEESRTVTDRLLRSQAVSLAQALAMGSGGTTSDRETLKARTEEFLKFPEVLAVAFFDERRQLIASSWRHSDQQQVEPLYTPPLAAADYLDPTPRESTVFGSYIEVSAPVIADTGHKGGRIAGSVVVCISRAQSQGLVGQTKAMALLIGGTGVLISLPLLYLLVHRIFQPIRALVAATNRLARGDLDARVAIHRPDDIGTLARCFNEMVKQIRQQQLDLASANASLEQANDDLERKVLERTDQLETANKRLAGEIADKEAFLRAVSHDLGAPLRNIAGIATMLLVKYRDRLESDVVHRLERIQKNVEVESDLIGELLELSRIKTRRQTIEPVEMEALIEELRGMFDNDLRTRGIDLVVETPLPVLRCERPRIRQVFQNLIDNAIKYMGDANTAPRIRIGCDVRPGEVEFWVADNGMGIDPDELDKVFFVFRRGKGAASSNISGKGVGLASVKSIIETYSGTIWVNSELAKGSTFHFTINGQYVSAENEPAESTQVIRAHAA